MLKELNGSLPSAISTVSSYPSLSSSKSALSPIPSLSLSDDSFGLYGKRSLESFTPSPSKSGSELSPIPSPSKSLLSEGSKGKRSLLSGTPSLSSSGSILLGIPSPSKSSAKIRFKGSSGSGSTPSKKLSSSVSGSLGSVPITISPGSESRSLSVSTGILLGSLGLDPPMPSVISE